MPSTQAAGAVVTEAATGVGAVADGVRAAGMVAVADSDATDPDTADAEPQALSARLAASAVAAVRTRSRALTPAR
ncbi:MAG: hypothetical protein H0X35_11795 [Pseudonocardiales bacterium]|nr:hypothetical protein [Pseudonocardiales bacterium]